MRRRALALLPVGVVIAALALLAVVRRERDEAPARGPEGARSVTARPSAAGVPRFDGARAFALVESLCAFGPRAPGTAGHDAAAEFLKRRLRAAGGEPLVQGFSVTDERGRPVAAANVVARFRPEQGDRILVGAHWDTRPRADRDARPDRRAEPIIGANDGGSGTALLLHIAEVMAASPPPIGVDLVLFDAEDWGEEGNLREYCLGSRHYASEIRRTPLPRAGLIVDMVGDADLTIRKESSSVAAAPQIVESIWAIAAEKGADVFLDEEGSAIFDDHVPLIQAGIPTLLLIDLDYPHWHTHDDLPDKMSAENLGQVGDVVLTWIYRAAP